MITFDYIKEELSKIAKLLQSDYREILDNSHKDKIRSMLDKAPVDWDTSYSIVNNKKVKNLNDLDMDDWTQDRDFRDRVKNLAVDGTFKDSKKDVQVKIIWGESEGRNKYVISLKNDKGEWEPKVTEYAVDAVGKKLNSLNSGSEDFDLEKVLDDVFKAKKKHIQHYLVQDLNMDYPWYVETQRINKKYSLQFSIKKMDPETVKGIIQEIENKQIGEKLSNYIMSLAEKEGFDTSQFVIKPSYKSANSFSILLRHK